MSENKKRGATNKAGDDDRMANKASRGSNLMTKACEGNALQKTDVQNVNSR